jgi:membrane protein DedA with SNARE-associated domain
MEQLPFLVERHGLLLVWGNVFLTQAGLPVPATPTLLVAGAFAAREQLSWPLLLAGAVTMSLIADYLWYVAGARLGSRAVTGMYRVFRVPEAAARRIEVTIERWGGVSLLFAKFIPGFALVAPPLAGMMRMSPLTFLVANGLGAALWAGLPIALGAYHQHAIHEALATLADWTGWIALAGLAALLAYALHARWARHVVPATQDLPR